MENYLVKIPIRTNNKYQKSYYSLDFARKTYLDKSVPADNNISVREYNKVSKYKNLEIEIKKQQKNLAS